MGDAARRPRTLVLVLHNHQPVGNFDHVFEDAYARCYEPVLEVLSRHPSIKIGLHYTGSLFEWILQNQRGFLDRLATLVERGQIEILGGGFYEPILSTLPDHDAVGQLEMMALFCKRYFGCRPEGMWLAERVWDPDLPRVLTQAGIRYTLLDDSHFRAAGVQDEIVTGHYLTEKAGHALHIFPIDQGLRYRIPFAEPEHVTEYLLRTPPDSVLTYGDDGEKFGLWPDTYDWVFGKRWLERFLGEIESADANNRIKTKLPSEALEEHTSSGRVYIPNASYQEMMEWALPLPAMVRLQEFRKRLEKSGELERYAPFLRGGIWQNFLAKYPESNRIHKKMIHLSRRLQSTMEQHPTRLEQLEPDRGDRLGTAQRELYKGQCCCAYWHGLFGGLYLNYLRSALYRALLSSEQILDELEFGPDDWIRFSQEDLDLDGCAEVLVRNRYLNAYIQPHLGGSVVEIDLKTKRFQLTDVLTRRPEVYHDLIKSGAASHEEEAHETPKTIHELVRVKEQGLEKVLFYDDAPRTSFVDRFYRPDVGIDAIRRGGDADCGDFSKENYQLEFLGSDEGRPSECRVHLWRRGAVLVERDASSVFVEKVFVFRADRSGMQVDYVLKNEGVEPVEFAFGIELNLTLLAGHDPSRYLLFGGSSERVLLASAQHASNIATFSMTDEWMGFCVQVDLSRTGDVFQYPIETVSQSEAGLERTYQGTCLIPVWRMRLERGKPQGVSVSLRMLDVPPPG